MGLNRLDSDWKEPMFWVSQKLGTQQKYHLVNFSGLHCKGCLDLIDVLSCTQYLGFYLTSPTQMLCFQATAGQIQSAQNPVFETVQPQPVCGSHLSHLSCQNIFICTALMQLWEAGSSQLYTLLIKQIQSNEGEHSGSVLDAPTC